MIPLDTADWRMSCGLFYGEQRSGQSTGIIYFSVRIGLVDSVFIAVFV